MDNTTGAQRQNYSNKSSEKSHGKVISSGKEPMIKAGGSGDGSGPTGSKRSYPKGSKVDMKPDFNPMDVKATDWAVGGVKD